MSIHLNLYRFQQASSFDPLHSLGKYYGSSSNRMDRAFKPQAYIPNKQKKQWKLTNRFWWIEGVVSHVTVTVTVFVATNKPRIQKFNISKN